MTTITGPAARARRFLSARWLNLAMANYEVDPAILRARIPAGTELDLWQGRCLVSIVGFLFLDTRLLGLPIPFHRNFEEVNLRFYVKRAGPEETRRGVVFIKEIVPRRAITWVANTVYNESYATLPMDHRDRWHESPRILEYRWRHQGRWSHLRVAGAGESFLAEESSEEAFITEHYWGYTVQKDGSTLEYQVEHPRWQVWRAIEQELDCDIAALYGQEFAPFLQGRPSSCCVADGSEVVVRWPRRC